ncbi:DUF6603 domain-containing protein [Streptomyces sp. NPDC054874]
MSDEGDGSQAVVGEAAAVLSQAQLVVHFPKDGKPSWALGASGEVAGRGVAARAASAPVGPQGARVNAVVGQVLVQAGLDQLPVIGPMLPAGSGRLEAGALLARSKTAPADAGKAGTLLNLLGVVLPPLKAEQLQRMRAGAGARITLLPPQVLEGWAAAKDAPQTHPPHTPPSAAVDAAPADPAGAVAAWELAAWLETDRTLGPLHLRRLGLVLRGERLWLLVDGGLELKALQLEAVGLGLGVPLDGNPGVQGSLEGLGVSFRAGPVRAAGALARLSPPPPQTRMAIGGTLVVTTPQISFGAAGMYAELKPDGRASVFAIAQVAGLRVPLGPVLLTGLIGGFGYNSQLVMPKAPAQVPTFPLVAGLTDPTVLPIEEGPAKVLAKLGETVRPAGGSVWGAAGVQLSLFKAVDATVVAAVQASAGDVSIALLGLATASFPVVKPYAHLALGLQAVYRASSGEIMLSGAIDPARSYLVHPQCHLQGGFAMGTWAPPSTHQGDFVVTVGGYHPAYRRPEHYPEVPRVGIRWTVGDTVQVSGECYAALTPSMAMLGGHLQVTYTSASVRAWLEARLDATVQWEPFAFEVAMGLRVGVEISFAGTHRLELGVSLRLWGPPMGGVAVLHLPLVPDVAIRFGEPKPQAPKALDFPAFHARVLGGQMPQLLITKGMLAEQKPAVVRGGDGAVRVAVGDFAVTLRTPLPCPQISGATGPGSSERLLGGPGTLTVRPMHQDQVTADVLLRLTSGTGPSLTYHSLKDWRLTAQRARVPASAFGAKLPGPVPDPRGEGELLPEQMVGVQLRSPEPRQIHPLGPMRKKVLDTETGATGRHPLPRPQSGAAPVAGSKETVRTALPVAAWQREAIWRAWRHWAPPQAPTTLADFPDRVHTLMRSDPLLAGAGSL